MSRQRRKRRPAEPKFYSTLAQFDGYCGMCSTSFGVGQQIYYCAKTDTTPTMRVHQHCYLKQMNLYAPSNPSRPTVRIGATGNNVTTVPTVSRRARHLQRLARDNRTH